MYYLSSANKKLSYFIKNYYPVEFGALNPKSPKTTLGERTSACRFCLKDRSQTTFSKAAHAIPAFLGNKVLFTNYECDVCNDRFSSFEDDFAKMTEGDRSFGQVPKREGLPAFKPQGKRSRMEPDGTGWIVKKYVDEDTFELDVANKRLITRYETQPYRPLGVYKALAKIAYTLLPDSELEHFEELRQWLNEPDVETKKVYADGAHSCWASFVPGPKPFGIPATSIWRRKTRTNSPYLMFFFRDR